MDDERILEGLWPEEHMEVTLRSALRRRPNRLGNGVELERPAESHFAVGTVATREPSRAGQLLVKVMYLSLDGVCLEQRAPRQRQPQGEQEARRGRDERAAAGEAETLLTRVGGVVRGLGVGMVVAVGGRQQRDGDSPALAAAQAGPGRFGVGQLVGGELGWREYALVSEGSVVAAPEEMGLPTVLSTLQAAHNAVSAIVGSGLLPPTATDRAACGRALQDLFNGWVESGRLLYSDERHARKLSTTSLPATPALFSRLWTPALSGLVSTTGAGKRKERYVPVQSDGSGGEPEGAAPALVAWVSGSANRTAAWVKLAQGPSIPMRAKL